MWHPLNISVYFCVQYIYRLGLYDKWVNNKNEPGSVVFISTDYGLGGAGSNSVDGRDFPHLSRPVLGPSQSPVQCVPGLPPGVIIDWGVTLTPHPLLVPWSWKSKDIPLLPLWAVQPVQSLSACTRVHFTFLLNKNGPGFDSAFNRNEYQEYLLGVKGGRCVGLTTLPPSCADCLKIWEPQPPRTLRACTSL